MTRHAAARAIATAPKEETIARETILAALAGVEILPESERRYEGTVCLALTREAPDGSGQRVSFEVDLSGVTKPRPGSLVFAAYYDGHAYRFGSVLATLYGKDLQGQPPALLYGIAESGHQFLLWYCHGYDPRIVGCVVRWWWTEEGGVRHGIECPQGAPWGSEWRIGRPGEAEGLSLALLPREVRGAW